MICSRSDVRDQVTRDLAAAIGFCCLALVAGGASLGGGSASCRSDLAPLRASLAAVADSANLQADLESLWDPLNQLVLARLSFGDDGGIAAGSVFSETLSDPVRARIWGVLEERAPRGTPGSELHLFLGDQFGPAVRMVGPLRQCSSSLQNADEISTELARQTVRMGVVTVHTVVLEVFVMPDGSVGERRIAQASGIEEIDRVALRAIDVARFSPARIEGIAVGSWARVTLTARPATEPTVSRVIRS